MHTRNTPRPKAKRNACIAALLLGGLLYWAIAMADDPLIDFDLDFGALISSIVPPAPSTHLLELA